jgi:hypothetical protein
VCERDGEQRALERRRVDDVVVPHAEQGETSPRQVPEFGVQARPVAGVAPDLLAAAL